MTKPVTKPVTKSVTILDRNTKNGQCVVEAVVSVLVTVSAEIIGQLEFRFRYRTETKIVVSVVHYFLQQDSFKSSIYELWKIIFFLDMTAQTRCCLPGLSCNKTWVQMHGDFIKSTPQKMCRGKKWPYLAWQRDPKTFFELFIRFS